MIMEDLKPLHDTNKPYSAPKFFITPPIQNHPIHWRVRGLNLNTDFETSKTKLTRRCQNIHTFYIDKDHAYNHRIFNAVSFQDHRHYHSNKRSYHEIRRTSDRICKEHGLSVIVPGQDKGKSYIEHQAEQNGTSYKAKLRSAIDRLLPGCTDLEDLLRRLQREGYELKQGKYISARAPDQERFTRLKTLGADYAEEAQTSRIAGKPSPSRQPKQLTGRPSLLIGIQNNIKAQQSAGYKHWATIENLIRAAETLNFLTEHGIGNLEKLSERRDGVAATARVKTDLRATEREMERLTLTMKHAATYRQLHPMYGQYRQSRDKEKFLRGHESEIILFKTAARKLKRLGAVPLPAVQRLRAEIDKLTVRRTALQSEYRKAQQKNGSTTPSAKTSVSYWNDQRMLYSRWKVRMNLNKRNN